MWTLNSSSESLYFTLPGNKLISKFERMERDQKFNFLTKNSQNVASLPDQDFPNTVLLFESRISYPALRVTSNNNLFEMSQFFWFSLEFSIKFTKNQFFSLFLRFSLFRKFLRSDFLNFNLEIIYRGELWIAHVKAYTLLCPEIN